MASPAIITYEILFDEVGSWCQKIITERKWGKSNKTTATSWLPEAALEAIRVDPNDILKELLCLK